MNIADAFNPVNHLNKTAAMPILANILVFQDGIGTAKSKPAWF
jgi:hypothetical protein